MVICNIKRFRLWKNYSQEYMALKLGISQSHYSKIERDNNELSIGRLIKIAAILEVSIADLFESDTVK